MPKKMMKHGKRTCLYLSRTVLVLCSCTHVIASAVKIIEGPHSVTNASIGGTVDFKCIAEGAASPPIWNINGKDYRVTELPLHHEYYLEGYLEIDPITLSMNDSIYYCYYKPYVDSVFTKVESDHATLLILPSAQTAYPSSNSITVTSTISFPSIPPRHVSANASVIVMIIIFPLFMLVFVSICIIFCCVCKRRKNNIFTKWYKRPPCMQSQAAMIA